MMVLTVALWNSRASSSSPDGYGTPRRDRYLVLDSRIIEATENAELKLGSIKKDPRNPLFKEDKPWEPRYDNVYANVIHDEQDGLYKCWYSPFIIDERTTSTPEAERNPSDHDYMRVKPNGREMGVCYAVSKDGIHWEKPELGLVEFDGNKKNNIVMRGYHFRGVFTGPHGAGVFKDLHESDLAKRYKMFFKGSKMAVAFSPDGLHWNLPVECPEINAHGDTHNNAFWAPGLGKYIGITRLKYGRPSIRQVAWTESPDFINWTKAKVVLEGVKSRLQTHDMVVFPTGGVYIGLLGMMDFPNAKSNFHTRQHVELAWSPDSRQWHRIQPGTPFIRHSPAEKEVYGKMPYDWGTIFASAPIFRENDIQIYYGACDWYFFDWRKGYLALATLRPDGWAGYEQTVRSKPAFITTTPVVCAGDELQLCADVQKNGYVKVMLFDKDNKEWLQSKSIKQTVTDAVVKWQQGFSIKNAKGKDIRLKFELKNAKLYSFGFDLKSQARIDLALSRSVADRKEDVERIVAELIEQKKKQEETLRKKEQAEQIRRSLPPEEQVPGLITRLRDEDPDVRSNAADQLAKISLQVKEDTAFLPAIAPLVAATSDKDMDVRDESTEALGNIGSRIKDKVLRKSIIDALVRMLSDDEAEVREEAAEALGNIASSITDKSVLQLAVAPLTRALKDDREATRRFAAGALEHIGTPKAREDWAAVDGAAGIKRDRYLLLDSRLVESAENARLVLGKTQKSRHNPLFAEDKPWEKRFDNLYANVIYDEAEGIYKCWYSPFIVDKSALGMTLEERKQERYRPPRNREMAICYATSKDGIAWIKPELGLVEYEASKATNILWRGSGDRKKLWGGPHGSGIFKDLHDPDPKRRYKAFLKAEILSVAFSADGIHWGPAIACPEADSAGDTHNNAFWAPTLGKYVGITREWGKAFGRQVARTSSEDFVNWSKSEVVLEGLDKGHQTYAMPVFYHGGVYLGLVAIHDQEADRVWTELTWSPDTVTWHRVLPGTPLIPNSVKEGEYDWGCVYAAACPVFLEDGIRLYYGGSDGKHTSWRNGFFCLATLRSDGWAGYEPVSANQPAVIKTTPVVCTGGDLRICADVEKNGYVKIKILDSDNKPLAEGELIAKTVTDGPVQWKDGFSFKKLKGKENKLRFELRDSKLYSFSFESSKNEEQSSSRGFVTIFDGKTLDGWHAVPKDCESDWTVRDGTIVGHGSADRLAYLVWKDEHLTDFELELQYRLPGNGNTGVEIRSQPDLSGKRPFEGYHADLGHVGIGPHILGAWDFHFATRKEYPCNRGTRLIINEDGKTHSSPIPGAITVADIHPHQWNDIRIIARGNHFEFFINGKLASDLTDNAKSGRLEQGAIGLQIHDKGMQVEFKDIRLKRLASAPEL